MCCLLAYLLPKVRRREEALSRMGIWHSRLAQPSPLRFQLFTCLLLVSISSVCFLIHRAGLHLGQSKGSNLGILPLGSSRIKAVSSQNVQERAFFSGGRGGSAGGGVKRESAWPSLPGGVEHKGPCRGGRGLCSVPGLRWAFRTYCQHAGALGLTR